MNTKLEQIIAHNESFVENRQYEEFRTTKFPDKKMVILSCMDTRLVELLPKAMNLRNGDAKILHNAGAIITQPFGNIMRSIIVAVYELQADEVFIIGHHDCGMTGIDPEQITNKMINSGIPQKMFDMLTHSGIHVSRWLKGFDSVKDTVELSVSIVRNHPLFPMKTPVHGLIIHPTTGKLDIVVDGYVNLPQ